MPAEGHQEVAGMCSQQGGDIDERLVHQQEKVRQETKKRDHLSGLAEKRGEGRCSHRLTRLTRRGTRSGMGRGSDDEPLALRRPMPMRVASPVRS